MTDRLSWRWIFWINLPIGLVAMLLCNRALRLLRRAGPWRQIDYPGAGLLTAMVTGWLLVMSWGGGRDALDRRRRSWAWRASACVLLALLAMQEQARPRPAAAAAAVRQRRVRARRRHRVAAPRRRCSAAASCCRCSSSWSAAPTPALGHADRAVPRRQLRRRHISGQLARRLGRMKVIVLGGLVGCGVGFALLATIGGDHAGCRLIGIELVAGLRPWHGHAWQPGLRAERGGAARRGRGHRRLLFLRSMGGAFGSTLVGALLASGFAGHLAAAGVVTHLDLGDVRQHGSAIAGIDPAMLPQVRIALVAAFHMGFLACAAAMGAALIAAIGMRDLPLRGGAPEQARAELAH